MDTWRVGGRIQGDRRPAAAVAADRVLMRMLMMRMGGEGLRLLVRGIIGVERFVACHQCVQHLEHHFRGRGDGATATATAAAAGRYRPDVAAAVRVRVDYDARRLPRRPRRPDAHDARRDVVLDCSARRLWSLPRGDDDNNDGGDDDVVATVMRRSIRATRRLACLYDS